MPNPRVQNSDEHIALFIARVRNRVDRYLYGPKPAFLARLSWILTLLIFAISTVWYIWAIPLKIGLNIYERHIRAIFPQLPSIRQKLLSLRTAVLAYLPTPPRQPGAASSTSGSRSRQRGQSTNAPAATLPKLNVDMDAIRAGGS